MKKVLMLGLICTLLLTGCGSKTLTCTKTEDESGMTMSEEVILKFDSKGNKIQKGSFSADVKVSDEYAEYVSEMAEYLEEEFEDVKELGVDVKTTTKDNTISVNVSYNATKLNDEQKDELYYADLYADTNYDETKSDFEDMGYTCK